jgi:pyruvate/2-oxoglutarate dehydrogenase complex dihydrolipoamide acyltransferase (E2) component
MSTKVNFPKSGMGIEEGTVARWLKAIGDHVEQDEVIVELETAKAIQEVTAPVSGRLTEILAGEGATVPVNSSLALIDESVG